MNSESLITEETARRFQRLYNGNFLSASLLWLADHLGERTNREKSYVETIEQARRKLFKMMLGTLSICAVYLRHTSPLATSVILNEEQEDELLVHLLRKRMPRIIEEDEAIALARDLFADLKILLGDRELEFDDDASLRIVEPNRFQIIIVKTK